MSWLVCVLGLVLLSLQPSLASPALDDELLGYAEELYPVPQTADDFYDRHLEKRSRQRQAGSSSWAGKRSNDRGFAPWAGKRSSKVAGFSSWAGKRAPFNSWAGKRSGGGLIYHDMES